MEKKKKRRLPVWTAICALLICSCMGITVSYAYQTSHAKKVNHIGIGHNTTEVTEEFPEPPPIPEEGKTYVKKVSVTNSQSVPCYIRVAVNYSDSDIGNAATLEKLNKTEWIYIAEDEDPKLGGYYYYNQVVQPAAATKMLFEGITISADADFSLQGPDAAFEVTVYEESVQAGEYTSYRDAWNQFIRE